MGFTAFILTYAGYSSVFFTSYLLNYRPTQTPNTSLLPNFANDTQPTLFLRLFFGENLGLWRQQNSVIYQNCSLLPPLFELFA